MSKEETMATNRGTNTINRGARVMSSDGKQLGVVKDVRVDRFLVDVRWAPDYWLGTETVEGVLEEEVRLFITKAGVGAAKLHLDVTAPAVR